jgi:glc operon protein GlcG
MAKHRMAVVAVLVALSSSVTILEAQQATMPPSAMPYGSPVNLETAKKAAAVALDEAARNHWTMAVAVVDPGGNLVYYEKMDNTQLGSTRVSVDKARSAALFKRPTKAFQDALAGGGKGSRVLGIEGAVPVEGGVPLIVDGKIIGAIGVSGDASENDAQCALAAAASMQKP